MLGRRSRILFLALSALLLWGCAGVPKEGDERDASDAKTASMADKPPVVIGLALGGGAARGFAHIGVIQVLEEAGIQPGLVVGTSAGSVVAALYASGQNGRQLESVAQGMDEASLSDWRLPLFKPGILKGEALARFVARQVQGRALEDLPLPVGVVATDLQSGEAVLFRKGDTASAVRASSAIPIVFEPVSIGGRDYVDGGLVSAVPVRFARQMGADIVLAVDVSSVPSASASTDMFQMLMQTFNIMAQSLNAYELQQADVVVRPKLTGLPGARFSARSQAIAAGRQAMLEALPLLTQAQRRLAAKPRG